MATSMPKPLSSMACAAATLMMVPCGEMSPITVSMSSVTCANPLLRSCSSDPRSSNRRLHRKAVHQGIARCVIESRPRDPRRRKHVVLDVLRVRARL